MHTDNLVLIDGDIIVYRVAFACQHKDPDDPTRLLVEPEGIVKARVDQMLNEILEKTDAGECMGWITDGKNNFRNKVAVTAPYKGNRFAEKPVHYDYIRYLLVEEHGFEVCYTQEADDMIGITHMDIGDGNMEAPIIIASIDKDLLMIPGMHYNIASKERTHITPFLGMKNFFTQVLTGDRTDNIIGLKGIGPIKAAKILEKTTDYSGLYTATSRAYAEADPDKWKRRLDENAELLWIRRDADFGFTWKHVANIYHKYRYPVKKPVAKVDDDYDIVNEIYNILSGNPLFKEQ